MERYAYTAHDLARIIEVPGKSLGVDGAVPDARDDFDRDRARVLHSAALRRLADKTQVVGPGTGDTPRTRLTHSLEVGQISRGIGKTLGVDPDLADLAGLTHDIGHPPYGHNGEDALNLAAASCGGFEGNAQTLRILIRLEPKTLGEDGQSYGLNLTRASLDAACKYPWGPVALDGTARRKYSCYADDLPVLSWIREGAPDGRKSLEAQIMDWSDDVAYSVHDVEDGIVSGRISLNVLWDLVELAALAEKGARAFGGEPEELIDAADRLRSMSPVIRAADFHGTLQDLAALKGLTSELVSRFVTASVTATRQAHLDLSTDGDPRIPLGRYAADLAIPDEVRAEVVLLKSLAVLYVMDQGRHQAQQERQRDRIFRVTKYLSEGAPGSLDVLFRPWWEAAVSDEDKLRVVIDQVASLTESRLVRLDKSASAISAAWG
ncbi:MAG: deoxyguanosinetriphosphate triphosphohydrolase [Mycobacteriaceae bacterium]|uniref:deoxyguanosinetriphosphate triphosphohydrolase n=1 Tax=Corynebacterium sp. TaxID=1720 RepID=UPI003F94B574